MADDPNFPTTAAADPVPSDPSAEVAPAKRPLVTGEIVARRGTWYFVARCLLIPTLMVVGGLYFLYDGFVGWPGSNQRIADLTRQAEAAKAKGDLVAEANFLNERKEIKPRGDLDIQIQKLLGFALTPLGLLAAVWFPYRSRGVYRLTADDVLHVPGHPPVPVSAITEMDKAKFDKKGIVFLKYELPTAAGAPPESAMITIDDFIYDQEPTDQILDRVEAALAPATAQVTSTDDGAEAVPAPAE